MMLSRLGGQSSLDLQTSIDVRMAFSTTWVFNMKPMQETYNVNTGGVFANAVCSLRYLDCC